ncbi:MAG: type II toxin-antitoxin system RelE/ParE family toxin [Phycisphaerae bacterium]|nr:type II toxin-antitoxin system RelE/ParE family toxin [Tepidisphaeraceae bacterium]
MGHYEVSPNARLDLGDIYSYIERVNSTAVAERMIRRIAKAFLLLADYPGGGRDRPDLGPGYRSLPERPYVIVYKPVDGGVRILRVVHGSRDLIRMFEDKQ